MIGLLNKQTNKITIKTLYFQKEKYKLSTTASRAGWTSSAGRAAAGGGHVTRWLRRASSRAAQLPPESHQQGLRVCTAWPSSCEFILRCVYCVIKFFKY